MKRKPPAPTLGVMMETVVMGHDGPVVSVGRDFADPATACMVVVDVLGVSVLLGPRHTVAVARALLAAAGDAMALAATSPDVSLASH